MTHAFTRAFARPLRAAFTSLAVLFSVGTMTSDALARNWLECVMAGGDPLQCWFNPDYEIMARVDDDVFTVPDRETVGRLERLAKEGTFRPYRELAEAATAGKLRRACEVSELLDVIEKAGRDTKMVAEACYRPAR